MNYDELVHGLSFLTIENFLHKQLWDHAKYVLHLDMLEV